MLSRFGGLIRQKRYVQAIRGIARFVETILSVCVFSSFPHILHAWPRREHTPVSRFLIKSAPLQVAHIVQDKNSAQDWWKLLRILGIHHKSIKGLQTE